MEDKVQAIKDAKMPKSVSELKTFKGIVMYYHRFIPNMSTTFAPLYDLLKKDKPWKWTRECEDAFDKVKEHLCSEQEYWYHKATSSHASPHSVGAVISHRMENGEERPTAYDSRSLTPAERNYAQLEKEALGIIFGVRKFHKYLYGRKFTLVTDHKPLTTILSPKERGSYAGSSKIAKMLILMSYQYLIQYRKSEEHGNAYMLSRFPETAKEQGFASELPMNYFSWV